MSRKILWIIIFSLLFAAIMPGLCSASLVTVSRDPYAVHLTDIGTLVQAYDGDLATWAGLTPSANGQSLVSAANYAAMRTLLDLTIGVNIQAYDGDLTTWAGLTPSAFFQTLVDDTTVAAVRTTIGAQKQAAIDVTEWPYNAGGDGVADDTAAIQAAINAAGSTGIVWFPAGNYLLSAPLVINDGYTLKGAYGDSHLIVRDAGEAAIDVTGIASNVSGVTIDGLLFDSAAAGCYGIKGTTATYYLAYWTISNCTFSANLGYGIYGYMGHCLVDNCRFGTSGTAGVVCQLVYGGGATNHVAFTNTFNHCHFEAAKGCNGAVEFHTGNSETFDHCVFQLMTVAPYYARGVSNTLFQSCNFEAIKPTGPKCLFDMSHDGVGGTWLVIVESCYLSLVDDANTDIDEFMLIESGGRLIMRNCRILASGYYTNDTVTNDNCVYELSNNRETGMASALDGLGYFNNVRTILIPDGGTIGQAAGPLLTFDDTLNYLEITGCKVGIGATTSPSHTLNVIGDVNIPTGSTYNINGVPLSGGGNMSTGTYDILADGFVDGNNTAYDATSWDNNPDAPTKNAVRDKIETLGGGHAAVTLATDADTILSLSTQEIGLDTQTANYIWAGPVSGAAADPTFRAMVDTDIPAAITRDAEVPGLETNAAVDSEAELEAILGIGFGTSKVGTSGYILVADGTDFESVIMSGDVSIVAGGATTISDDSHAHTASTISGLGIADLANGTDGELITWDATGAPAVVATGTVGHVLKSGGAGVAPAFAAESDPTVDTSAEIQTIIGAGVYEPAGVAVADITDASANGRSLISAANYAAMRTLLDLEAGTDFYSMSAADTAFEAELDNSAGLLAALNDATGTGFAVFSTSPTLVTPILGTPTSGTLTNCTFPARSAITEHSYIFNIFKPYNVYAKDTHICIDPNTRGAMKITDIQVRCDDDPDAELDWDLYYADSFIGMANATLIHVLDTTAGVFSSGPETLAVPAAKCVYVVFAAQPETGMTQISVKLIWDYD